MMNGKPCIGAPRPLYGSKKRLNYEPEPGLRAEPPLNFEEMREIVERAKQRGLITVTKDACEFAYPVHKYTRRADGTKNYGSACCYGCGKWFDKAAPQSFWCEPCKWAPRPCAICSKEFVPKSAPKRNMTIQTCSQACMIEKMRRSKLGKPPANKRVKRK